MWVEVESSLSDHLAISWYHCVFCEAEEGSTDFRGVGFQVDPLILQGEVTLAGVDAAFVFTEEVPSQDKIIDEIAHNSAVHPEMPFIYTEHDVHDAESLNFATIDAIGPAKMRGDFVVIQFRVTSEEVFTNARPAATCVT